MKNPFHPLSICALVLTMAACGAKGSADARQLSRFVSEGPDPSEAEAVIYACTWADGLMQELAYNNPYSEELDFDARLSYDEGRVSVIDDNRFVTRLSYDEGRLSRIDQLTHDGIRLHQYVIRYTGDGCAEITHNAMTPEAIRWIEAVVYDKRDSLGNEVRYDMPSDTSLHLSAVGEYHWKEGNLASISCRYIEAGFTSETTLEYDHQANPFYGQCVGFNRLDAMMIEIAAGTNRYGLSRNNITKAHVVFDMADGQHSDLTREFVYEYEDGCPVRVSVDSGRYACRYIYE